MKRLLFLLLCSFVCGVSAQESEIWDLPLSNVGKLQSYRLQAKSVSSHGSTEAGDGTGTFASTRVTKVSCQGTTHMRLEEEAFRDPKLSKRTSKAVQVYDGNSHYFVFTSPERNQKFREDMRAWIEAGQPFQAGFPSWGGCFSDKQDYRGMVKAFAELPGWEKGKAVPVNGRLCQTFENTVPENDPPCRYRVYIDREGWVRGIDTFYEEENHGEPTWVHRVRYLNLETNPSLPATTFQLDNPDSFPLLQ